MKDSEWETQLCLTAFDVLCAHASDDALADIEDDLDDNEREVLRRVVDMSVSRRLAEGML